MVKVDIKVELRCPSCEQVIYGYITLRYFINEFEPLKTDQMVVRCPNIQCQTHMKATLWRLSYE